MNGPHRLPVPVAAGWAAVQVHRRFELNAFVVLDVPSYRLLRSDAS
jgi:hypothetical protein